MSMQQRPFEELIQIKHGYAFKSEFFRDHGKYVVLTPGHFFEEGGFRSRPEKDRFYDGEIPEGFILPERALIVAMTEQGPGLLGSSALVPEGEKYLHNQRIGLVTITDPSVLDKDFLYRLFNTKHVRAQINGSASGVKVRHTAPERIYRVVASIPALHTQRRIASALAAYDHLIGTNRRRIQLLEDTARLLYREWFVLFRFPGHEHVTICDGVPEGWEKRSAFESMDVLSGGTPKTGVADYWGGEIPFYTPKDASDSVFTDETEKRITERGLKACNSALYPRGTVFITARGTVGKLNIAGRPMAMNQSCYALVAHAPLTQEFLYFALSAGVEQLRSHAAGAVFDAIIRDTFKHISFILPNEALVTEFSESVKLTLALVANLQAQNRALVSARDLLLPKLMSGELEV